MDIFWNCTLAVLNLLYSCFSSQKIGHKRVMLFTNNDNPHADDPALQVRLLFCIFGDVSFAPVFCL